MRSLPQRLHKSTNANDAASAATCTATTNSLPHRTAQTNTRNRRELFSFRLLTFMTTAVLVLCGRYVYKAKPRQLLRATERTTNRRSGRRMTPSTCPSAIVKAIGVYEDDRGYEMNGDGLEDVLLLVSSNFGYLDMLRNWEYMAKKRLGLKFGIVAMDEKLYRELGESNSILVDNVMGEESALYGKEDFNKITCNKMRLVLDVMDKCDVDVVFSDVDNMLLQDPFKHDLGRLIRMRVYDYIYQDNISKIDNEPRTNKCLNASLSSSTLPEGNPGGWPYEGNTGFYYLSRHSNSIKDIMRESIKVCDEPNNKQNDQVLFWKTLRERWRGAASKTATSGGASLSWSRCTADNGYDTMPTDAAATTTNSGQQNVSRICCLDPYYYPIGTMKYWHKDIVAYHANYIQGHEAKVKELKRKSVWYDDQINKNNQTTKTKRI